MLTTSQVPYSLRLGHDCPSHPGEFIRERDGATLAGRLAAVHAFGPSQHIALPRTVGR